jgi:Spy/CpxP family protein refolding chaperone
VKKLQKLWIVLSLLMLAVAGPVSAQMGEMMGGGKSGMRDHGKMGQGVEQSQSHKKGQQSGHGMGHPFAPSWKKTLTDEQKVQADKMHLALKKSIYVLKAQLIAKKAELNSLVVQDNPGEGALYGKIDEVLELKREIMRKKYDHIRAVRGMLTPEQRISFDMKHIGMAGHKMHCGH